MERSLESTLPPGDVILIRQGCQLNCRNVDLIPPAHSISPPTVTAATVYLYAGIADGVPMLASILRWRWLIRKTVSKLNLNPPNCVFGTLPHLIFFASQ